MQVLRLEMNGNPSLVDLLDSIEGEYYRCRLQTNDDSVLVNKNKVYRALQRVYRILLKKVDLGTVVWSQREGEWLAVLRWWGCSNHRDTGESSTFNTDGSNKEDGIDWDDRSSRLQAEALRLATAGRPSAGGGRCSGATLQSYDMLILAMYPRRGSWIHSTVLACSHCV